MTSFELSKEIVQILDSKKAQDIQLMHIRDLTIIADYFVLASGSSSTQVKTLVDEVEFQLKQQGLEPARVEGYASNNWIILDYHDVVVHIFYTETREFYSLERLWSDAEQVDIQTVLGE